LLFCGIGNLFDGSLFYYDYPYMLLFLLDSSDNIFEGTDENSEDEFYKVA